MTRLYMPGSAAIISFILLFVYLSKERIKIKENNIYLAMLICIMVDSLSVFSIFSISGPGESLIAIKILNRFDYMALVAWSSCLLRYAHTVLHKKDEGQLKRTSVIQEGITILALVECILIWILKLDAIVEDGVAQVITGTAVYFTFACCALHVFLSLLIILLNIKKATKQIVPVFICLAITALIVFTYYFDPGISGVSIGLAIVNLTMYFTIENPDVQMLEQVNLTKEQALRANQAKTDFLSSMSHEIRTPINAISGLAECIQNDTSLEAAKTDAKDILNASENLLEIVNGILDISKIEAGRMEVVNKEYDLTDMADKLAKLIRARIGEKPIELKVRFAKNIPGILYGDESKIRQIMTNLLTNAVKYTEKGHVSFTIGCTNSDDISNLSIIVSDTGRGIKEDVIDSLFDKFKRLEEDRNTNIEGTGLGLAITKQFVEMLKGTIEVKSVYGEGSTFIVNLSQEIRSMERKEFATDNHIQSEYPGKKVLVVDDTAVNLMVAKRFLELYKIDADTAASGEECIEKCKSSTYDLVLLDDMMPRMSGTDTLAILKEDPSFTTPVVAFTANAIEGMKDNYISNGYNDYLSKPLVKGELGRILEKFLS